MKDKCQMCGHRSTDCVHGLWTLPLADLLAWCRDAKKKAGVTNPQISEWTGIPLSTVERTLSGKKGGVQFASVQPIVLFLLELQPDRFGCPIVMDEKLDIMEAEHTEAMAAAKSDERRRLDFLKAQIDSRDQTIKRKETRITRLMWALIAICSLTIVLLVVDFLSPEIGFFRN